MKRKIPKILIILPIVLAVITAILWCAARFVYLSPGCYADNKTLTERENYFIKKIVLEAVENRLSVFADGYDMPDTNGNEENAKHIFICINSDFWIVSRKMITVTQLL